MSTYPNIPPVSLYGTRRRRRGITPYDNPGSLGLFTAPNGSYTANTYPTTAQNGAQGEYGAFLPTVTKAFSTIGAGLKPLGDVLSSWTGGGRGVNPYTSPTVPTAPARNIPSLPPGYNLGGRVSRPPVSGIYPTPLALQANYTASNASKLNTAAQRPIVSGNISELSRDRNAYANPPHDAWLISPAAAVQAGMTPDELLANGYVQNKTTGVWTFVGTGVTTPSGTTATTTTATDEGNTWLNNPNVPRRVQTRLQKAENARNRRGTPEAKHKASAAARHSGMREQKYQAQQAQQAAQAPNQWSQAFDWVNFHTSTG